jgi:hypothetical protein
VDYRIRRNAQELDSTGYLEIGPGKYSGQHWQEGCLFVWEDAFGLAEGIVTKHFPSYDHLSMNDIPKNLGRKIVADWRGAADRLAGMGAAETRSALNLPEWYERLDEELVSHKSEIGRMLQELADGVDEFCDKGDWFCILGV